MSKYSFVNKEITNPSWQGLKHEWTEGGGVTVTVDLIKKSDNSHVSQKFTFEDMWEAPWYKQQEIIIDKINEFVREGE